MMGRQHCWVRNGQAAGQIVVARTAGVAETHAAEELSRYIENWMPRTSVGTRGLA